MHPDILVEDPVPLEGVSRTLKPVMLAVAAELPLIGAFGLQLLASWLLCRAAGRSLFVGIGGTFDEFLSALPLYGFGALAVALVYRRHTLAPNESALLGYRRAWRSLRTSLWRIEYVTPVLIAFAVLPTSLAVFSAAKRAIPLVHPFTWDARLERIGLALHGGRHLWQWLAPVIADAQMMRAVSWFYHFGWPLAILGATVVVALVPPGAIRTRYLVASVLTWFLVGTVGALLLSSAGPPYYAAVTGSPSPYAGLFAVLKREAVPALEPQAALWQAYRHGVDQFGFGISAMPSIHVAAATLLACLGWSVHRVLGSMLTFVAMLTFLASVMLGWHYSLDGYVGAAMAVAIWWLSGKLVGAQRARLA